MPIGIHINDANLGIYDHDDYDTDRHDICATASTLTQQ